MKSEITGNKFLNHNGLGGLYFLNLKFGVWLIILSFLNIFINFYINHQTVPKGLQKMEYKTFLPVKKT